MPFEPRIFAGGAPGDADPTALDPTAPDSKTTGAKAQIANESTASEPIANRPAVPAPWASLGADMRATRRDWDPASGRGSPLPPAEFPPDELSEELPADLAILADQLSTDSVWISQAYPPRNTIIPSLVNDALVAAAMQRHPYRVAMARAWNSCKRGTVATARVVAAGVPWRRAAHHAGHYAWSWRPVGYRGWHGLAACCMVAAAIALALLPNWNDPLAPAEGVSPPLAQHTPAIHATHGPDAARPDTLAPTNPMPSFAPQLGTSGLGSHRLSSTQTAPRTTRPSTPLLGPVPPSAPTRHRRPQHGVVPMLFFQDLTPSEQEGVLDLLDESDLPGVSVEI